MKNLFLILSIILTILAYYSCTDLSINDNLEHLATNEIELRTGPKITVKLVPHRKIKERPRDGKNCNCEACFGVCKVEVSVGWDIKPGFDGGELDPLNNILYFTDPLPNEDLSEFVVDEDILVELPESLQEDYGFDSMTIEKGSYNFITETNNANYYGQVELDIQYTN